MECTKSKCTFSVFKLGFPTGRGSATFSGRRDKSFFIVPVQRDNGTSSKSCQGMGRDGIFDILSQDVPWDKITLKFGHFQKKWPDSCFRTSFCCFRTCYIRKKMEFLWFFWNFWPFYVNFFPLRYWFWPATSQDFCSCPCPGTKGQRNIFVPWKPYFKSTQNQQNYFCKDFCPSL